MRRRRPAARRTFPRRRRRGALLAAAVLAAAVLALMMSGWAERERRAAERAGAEGAARRLAELAWHLDSWLHDQPGLTLAAPSAPRELTAAERNLMLAAGGFAAPWINPDNRIFTGGTPPPSADWHVRFAVGWPSGSDPAAAGTGPPHGALMAEALTDEALGAVWAVRAALARLGGGAAGAAAATGTAEEGDIAQALARAAGFAAGAGDIALAAWAHSTVPPNAVLRRPRAGREAPGMDAELLFGPAGGMAAGRFLTGPGGVSLASAGGSGGTDPDFSALSLQTAALDARGTVSVAGEGSADHDITAAGDIEAGSLSADGTLVTTGRARFRTGTVAGRAEADRLTAQSARARVSAAVAGTADADEVSAERVDASSLSVTGTAEVYEIMFAPGGAGLNSGLTVRGTCVGC